MYVSRALDVKRGGGRNYNFSYLTWWRFGRFMQTLQARKKREYIFEDGVNFIYMIFGIKVAATF